MNAQLESVRVQSLKLFAIQAIADGRWRDARTAFDQLTAGADLVVSGVCRYCGCSDLRPCGIAVLVGERVEPVGCRWVDEQRTVCSNTRCLDAWARDAAYPPPERGGVSLLVRP